MSDTPVITHRYIFKDFDGVDSFFTVTDITSEHVYYQLEDSRHVHAMLHEIWIEGNYKDVTNA